MLQARRTSDGQEGGRMQHLLRNPAPLPDPPHPVPYLCPCACPDPASAQAQPSHTDSRRAKGSWVAFQPGWRAPCRAARRAGLPGMWEGRVVETLHAAMATARQDPLGLRPAGRAPQPLFRGGILPSCPSDSEWPQIPRTTAIDRVTGNKEKRKALAGFGSASLSTTYGSDLT